MHPFQRLLQRSWSTYKKEGSWRRRSAPSPYRFEPFVLKGFVGESIVRIRGSKSSYSTPAEDGLDPAAYTHYEVEIDETPAAFPSIAEYARALWRSKYGKAPLLYDPKKVAVPLKAGLYGFVPAVDIQKMFEWFIIQRKYL
jgi:hypothetical protein